MDTTNLEPGELIGLWETLHALQSEKIDIEHILVLDELIDLCTEWDCGAIASLGHSGDINVVCHN